MLRGWDSFSVVFSFAFEFAGAFFVDLVNEVFDFVAGEYKTANSSYKHSVTRLSTMQPVFTYCISQKSRSRNNIGYV